jgi:GTP-binding protein
MGDEFDVRLELKLLADVGIIGAPNAGKSSLLSALTAARPKVADYPFTTLEAALGVVEHRGKDVVLVDIPGLIEGAHAGVGLGHDFLRHIERTRILVHVIDGSLDDPLEQYREINNELSLFDAELMDKSQIVALNKIDIPEVRERIDGLSSDLSEESGTETLSISAAGREGLAELMDAVMKNLEIEQTFSEQREVKSPENDLPVLRPRPRSTRPLVRKDADGVFIVESADAIRIAAMVDVRKWEARIQFYRRLQHTGIDQALIDAGIMPGDSVRIGALEWEWE